MKRKRFKSKVLVVSVIIAIMMSLMGCANTSKESNATNSKSKTSEKTEISVKEETISTNTISNDQKALILERKHNLETQRAEEIASQEKEMQEERKKQELEQEKQLKEQELNNNEETIAKEPIIEEPVANEIPVETKVPETTPTTSKKTWDMSTLQGRYDKLNYMMTCKDTSEFTSDVYGSYTAEEVMNTLKADPVSLGFYGHNITVTGTIIDYADAQTVKTTEMVNGQMHLQTSDPAFKVTIIIPAYSGYQVGQTITLTGVVYDKSPSNCNIATCNMLP